MKILFILTEPPVEPLNGVRIVSHNAIKSSIKGGAEIFVLILSEKKAGFDDKISRSELNEKVQFHFENQDSGLTLRLRQLKSFICKQLVCHARFNSKRIRKRLRRILSSFKPDIVHLDTVALGCFASLLKQKTYVVLSINDSYTLTLREGVNKNIYHGIKKTFYRIEARVAKNFEKNYSQSFDCVHVVSETDRSFLLQLDNDSNIEVIQNCIEDLDDLKKSFQMERSTKAVFCGKLAGWNLVALGRFVNEGLPLIRGIYECFSLDVIGRMTDDAKRLQKKETMSGVNFLGFVADLRCIYLRSKFVIVPIDKNFGISNKALEAMACGCCVIGFEGAFSGIDGAVHRKNCVVVSSYAEIGQVIIELIRNPSLCQKIGLNAAHLIYRKYNMDDNKLAFFNMYKRVRYLGSENVV